MSKQSTIQRAARREAMVAKLAPKREALKLIIADRAASVAAREAARGSLAAMPRDASPVRLVSRCALTGRSGSVFSRFGLSRHELRRLALAGLIPGMAKASW